MSPFESDSKSLPSLVPLPEDETVDDGTVEELVCVPGGDQPEVESVDDGDETDVEDDDSEVEEGDPEEDPLVDECQPYLVQSSSNSATKTVDSSLTYGSLTTPPLPVLAAAHWL